MIRPEDLVHMYRNQVRSYQDYKRRKNREIDDQKVQGLVFILRIQGDKGLSENQRKLLKFLKLKKMHEGRVFQSSPKLQKIIQSLENLIIYGKISLENLHNLIQKRGFIRKEK